MSIPFLLFTMMRFVMSDCINQSRRNRIAKGSGNSIDEVNRITKQFEQMRKMMKMMTGNKFGNLMRNMPKR